MTPGPIMNCSSASASEAVCDRAKIHALSQIACGTRGMSIEEARNYSDNLYPPTPDDIAYEQKLRQGAGFPWPSALSLLYPFGALIYIATRTPAPITMIVGYGLANLAYLLFAAGILAGKFGVFGLQKRWHILIVAAICFCLGTFLSNI
jgi:hypothetical protein